MLLLCAQAVRLVKHSIMQVESVEADIDEEGMFDDLEGVAETVNRFNNRQMGRGSDEPHPGNTGNDNDDGAHKPASLHSHTLASFDSHACFCLVPWQSMHTGPSNRSANSLPEMMLWCLQMAMTMIHPSREQGPCPWTRKPSRRLPGP